jgi:hypothetical protein
MVADQALSRQQPRRAAHGLLDDGRERQFPVIEAGGPPPPRCRCPRPRTGSARSRARCRPCSCRRACRADPSSRRRASGRPSCRPRRSGRTARTRAEANHAARPRPAQAPMRRKPWPLCDRMRRRTALQCNPRRPKQGPVGWKPGPRLGVCPEAEPADSRGHLGSRLGRASSRHRPLVRWLS